MKRILIAGAAIAAVCGAAHAHSFTGPSVGLEVASEDYNPTPEGEAVYAITAGWDFEVAPGWVAGAGARYTLHGVSSSKTSVTPAGLLQTADVSIEDQWALTGRIGHVINETVLVFAEGGYEQFDINAVRTVRAQVCAPPSGCVVSRNDFSFEDEVWTIGAGVEWAVSDQVRLRGTYSYGDSDAIERNRFSTALAWRF